MSQWSKEATAAHDAGEWFTWDEDHFVRHGMTYQAEMIRGDMVTVVAYVGGDCVEFWPANKDGDDLDDSVICEEPNRLRLLLDKDERP